MKQSILKGFFVVYMQIGVNVIGLPEFHKLYWPKYELVAREKNKYHK